MNKLIDSADDPIPSFMLLQAGITDDKSQISITTYYRALEVSKFLPINIAESCLVIEKINKAFSFNAKSFAITIHAFNAYYIENFSCLEKAPIDTLSEMEIMLEISFLAQGKKWIHKRLEEKRDLTESRINSHGIQNLIAAIELYNARPKDTRIENYDTILLSSLEEVLDHIKHYNSIKAISSYAEEAKIVYKKIKDGLNKIIQIV